MSYEVSEQPPVLAAVSDEARFAEAVRRVRLGYAWIQEQGEPFDLSVERMEPDFIDMTSWDECALGQASGGDEYANALRLLVAAEAIQPQRLSPMHLQGTLWGCEHGFSTYGDGFEGPAPGYVINGILVTYDDLTRAWRQVVQEERSRDEAG